MIAFDLDGCLIDSEELIRQSYQEAGADPPAGFMALGHHDWIEGDTAAVHAAKNAAYLRRLKTREPAFLPAWDAAWALRRGRKHRLALVTGAPPEAVQAVRDHVPEWPFDVAAAGLNPLRKTAWLAVASSTGVYVDDQVNVTIPPGWRFIRYTGQDAATLVTLITCP